MQVLVVDDDEISRSMLAFTLAQAGFEVLTAIDGLEALDVLRNSVCRLVIADWEMPRMDGLQLCQAVRRGEFAGYIYLILLTGHEGREQRVAGLTAGADDFQTKPFDSAEMVERVRAGERVLSLETRDALIFSLAKLAEARDPETGAHLDRVRGYCRLLAQQLASNPNWSDEVDGEFIRLISATSALHDVGKVGIPDNVLLKPGRLTDDEMIIMRTHANLGADTLRAALVQYPQAKFLRMACDIAATHHEKWDGTGYPAGLSGEAIPRSGRIMALADVYDALTSKRVYKPAFNHGHAREIILNESGKHFDPDVVEAFLTIEPAFQAIHRQFDDKQLEVQSNLPAPDQQTDNTITAATGSTSMSRPHPLRDVHRVELQLTQ